MFDQVKRPANPMTMTYRDIPGWMNYEATYGAAVQWAPPRAHFVEVGSCFGRSACYMAELIRDSGKLIKFDAIDLGAINLDVWLTAVDERARPLYSNPADPVACMPPSIKKAKETGGNAFSVFLENVRTLGLASYLNPIQGESTKLAASYRDASLDFVWIDAGHDYEDVLADLNAWYPKIKPGGILAGHDFCDEFHDVVRAVTEFFAIDRQRVRVHPSSWLIQRTPDKGDSIRPMFSDNKRRA